MVCDLYWVSEHDSLIPAVLRVSRGVFCLDSVWVVSLFLSFIFLSFIFDAAKYQTKFGGVASVRRNNEEVTNEKEVKPEKGTKLETTTDSEDDSLIENVPMIVDEEAAKKAHELGETALRGDEEKEAELVPKGNSSKRGVSKKGKKRNQRVSLPKVVENLQFGTVCIFTCSADCYSLDTAYCEEVAVVQPES